MVFCDLITFLYLFGGGVIYHVIIMIFFGYQVRANFDKFLSLRKLLFWCKICFQISIWNLFSLVRKCIFTPYWCKMNNCKRLLWKWQILPPKTKLKAVFYLAVWFFAPFFFKDRNVIKSRKIPDFNTFMFRQVHVRSQWLFRKISDVIYCYCIKTSPPANSINRQWSVLTLPCCNSSKL